MPTFFINVNAVDDLPAESFFDRSDFDIPDSYKYYTISPYCGNDNISWYIINFTDFPMEARPYFSGGTFNCYGLYGTAGKTCYRVSYKRNLSGEYKYDSISSFSLACYSSPDFYFKNIANDSSSPNLIRYINYKPVITDPQYLPEGGLDDFYYKDDFIYYHDFTCDVQYSPDLNVYNSDLSASTGMEIPFSNISVTVTTSVDAFACIEIHKAPFSCISYQSWFDCYFNGDYYAAQDALLYRHKEFGNWREKIFGGDVENGYNHYDDYLYCQANTPTTFSFPLSSIKDLVQGERYVISTWAVSYEEFSSPSATINRQNYYPFHDRNFSLNFNIPDYVAPKFDPTNPDNIVYDPDGNPIDRDDLEPDTPLNRFLNGFEDFFSMPGKLLDQGQKLVVSCGSFFSFLGSSMSFIPAEFWAAVIFGLGIVVFLRIFGR